MDKKISRLRRAKKTRIKMRESDKVRLCINKTPKHIYAQVISGDGATVIVSASTVEDAVKKECAYTGNVVSSAVVGKFVAQRALEKGSGFRYHGRVKALAEAARENGLEF